MGVGPTRRLTITFLQSALAPQRRNPILTESIFSWADQPEKKLFCQDENWASTGDPMHGQGE